MRAAGLQIAITSPDWFPDTLRPDFAVECRRQSRLVAQADEKDANLQRFMDESIADLETELVDLSRADQECVAQALLSPSPPSPALGRAFERRKLTLDDLLAMQGNDQLEIDGGWDAMPAAGLEQAQSSDPDQ